MLERRSAAAGSERARSVIVWSRSERICLRLSRCGGLSTEASGAPAIVAQEQSAQTKEVKTEAVQVNAVKSSGAAATPLQPKWTAYKGVTIGMSTDEVRAKLDHLKDKGKQEDFFVFSDTESAQVYYDDQGKVQAISINYVNDKRAPGAVAVLGEEVQAQADGSIYKLVRYPEAGF